jgi:hypothetical protein
LCELVEGLALWHVKGGEMHRHDDDEAVRIRKSTLRDLMPGSPHRPARGLTARQIKTLSLLADFRGWLDGLRGRTQTDAMILAFDHLLGEQAFEGSRSARPGYVVLEPRQISADRVRRFEVALNALWFDHIQDELVAALHRDGSASEREEETLGALQALRAAVVVPQVSVSESILTS